MSKNILIVRNILNQKLLKQTNIEYAPQIHISGENGLYGLKLLEKLFIKDKIQTKYDFVCLIDEDCFLYDVKNLKSIVSYMEENGIDIMGVPDGGEIEIRKHRPDVPNLFFVIMKCEKLRNLNEMEYRSYEVPIGKIGKDYSYDSFEPYYKFLCFVVDSLKCNFQAFEAKNVVDEVTTEVYFQKLPVCLHTWYARKYGKDKEQTTRINNALVYAKTKK